jgi:hypothetical protein
MPNQEIDIVIPVHKKDLPILEHCIFQARRKISGVRRVIVVSKERYTNNAEWFDEALYPFSYKEVHNLLGGSHVGWNYQQLLKLYSSLVIPGISENVLVLDSDTVFFKKVRMLDDDGRALFNLSKDKNINRKPFDTRVEEHIKNLFPAISRQNLPQNLQDFSGICHHMVFNRKIIAELFEKVENFHEQKTGIKQPFYKLALADCGLEMSLAEYQIYFNYVAIFHSEKIAIRKLNYKNTADSNIRKYRFRFKYHYCSFHSYLRGSKTKCMSVRSLDFLAKLWKKLFLLETWNIGVAKCNIAEFLTIPSQEIFWLKSKNKFFADPFGSLGNKGEKQIYFEYYDRLKRKGEIRRIALDDRLKIQRCDQILEKKSHLSYPYIFADGEKKYALVESYKEKILTLYELGKNGEFIALKNIIENQQIADPSIVKFNQKWWLFFTLVNRGDSELYVAYSSDLNGSWQMHKKNPVKIDDSSSRMGGEIFWHKDSLYRPSQNCSGGYGGALVINKITELSEENFSEEKEIDVTPNQFGRYPDGLHTISKLGENLTLVDGKKFFFSPIKPLFSLLRLCFKIFSCRKTNQSLVN